MYETCVSECESFVVLCRVVRHGDVGRASVELGRYVSNRAPLLLIRHTDVTATVTV